MIDSLPEMTVRELEMLGFEHAIAGHLRAQGFELGGFIGHKTLKSVVREAVQVEDGRRVAVKMYLNAADADLFEREQGAYRAIGRRETIVELIDSGAVDLDLPGGSSRKFMYLVLERGERSLRQDLNEGTTKFDEESVARLAYSLAMALDHVHEGEFIHADIKPENILLVDGVWKLCDFSIAHEYDRILLSSTDYYVHPDRLELANVLPNPAHDLFNLGLILYEILSGHRVEEKDEGYRRGLPPKLDRRHPRALAGDGPRSRQLDRICLGCLHPDPSYRYGLAADLKGDLNRHLGGGKIQLPTQPLRSRAWRHARARPFRTAFLAVALIGGLSYSGYSEAARQRESIEFRQKFDAIADAAALEKSEAQAPLDASLKLVKAAHSLEGVDLAKLEKAQSSGSLHAGKLSNLIEQARKMGEELRLEHLRESTERMIGEMLQGFRDIEARYKLLADDLATCQKLEEVRRARASTLIVRTQKGSEVLFNFAEVAERYAAIFRDDLAIDPSVANFDVEAEARRLIERPGQRQFATYLMDWNFVRAQMLAASLKDFFNLLQPERTQQQMLELELARQLAQRIDDQDAWTWRFHQAFRPNPFEILLVPDHLANLYGGLAGDANPTEVPISKLTIVAEVLWDHDRDRAIDFLKRVLEAHPNDYWVNHLLGEMLKDRNRPGDLPVELQCRFAAYRNQNPPAAVTCWMLADAHRRRGDAELAAKYLEEAIRKDPRLRTLGVGTP